MMIMKAVIQDDERRAVQYATVSREWQAVVEPVVFGQLKLTQSRLAGFAKIVPRQRALVKCIWLCIELQAYVSSRSRYAGILWHEANVKTVGTAIRSLFSILSAWAPAGTLVLDISAHSPNDDTDPLRAASDVIMNPSVRRLIPLMGYISDYFWQCQAIKMTDSFWGALPKVPAVTGLLLRRRTLRRWELGTSKGILSRLPGLQEIHYEPSSGWAQRFRENKIEDPQAAFGSPIFRQLRKVVLFERFSDTYDFDFHVFPGYIFSGWPSAPVRTATAGVSEALAEASLDFQHLAASFIIDAQPFFQMMQPSWVWNRLISLVLTSHLLVPEQNHAAINDLLQTAAAAAMKMPKLESMELWNGKRGLACVYRYQSSRGIRPAEILWRGTWMPSLRAQTVGTWENVAKQKDAQCEFRVSKELLDAESITSCGEAIERLGLLQPVMYPGSDFPNMKW
ncbi:MAG: hypothetical protein Q9168_003110 [Polycauliona sp. 1 TL-2023]